MRIYELHDSGWTRIVTHRVRRPNVIAARLGSRRRRDRAVPIDGQLVLIDGTFVRHPVTDRVVERRELLDRLAEAVSIDGVDGVVAPADVLEDLTLLNMLENRLAVCATSGGRAVPAAHAVAGSGFDAAVLSTAHVGPTDVGQQIDRLQQAGLPTLVDIARPDPSAASDFDVAWSSWVEPIHDVGAAVSTGPGVWLTMPAIAGLERLAGLSAFPVLVRDTDVPVDVDAWAELFAQPLPITIRGIVAGASALFPSDGSVAAATQAIASAVRGRLA